jgi:electron transport complex protein RnfC
VDLPVHLIGRNAEYDSIDNCAKYGVTECIDCGLCAYSCPARRPLVHFIKYAKDRIAQRDRGEGVSA